MSDLAGGGGVFVSMVQNQGGWLSFKFKSLMVSALLGPGRSRGTKIASVDKRRVCVSACVFHCSVIALMTRFLCIMPYVVRFVALLFIVDGSISLQ